MSEKMMVRIKPPRDFQIFPEVFTVHKCKQNENTYIGCITAHVCMRSMKYFEQRWAIEACNKLVFPNSMGGVALIGPYVFDVLEQWFDVILWELFWGCAPFRDTDDIQALLMQSQTSGINALFDGRQQLETSNIGRLKLTEIIHPAAPGQCFGNDSWGPRPKWNRWNPRRKCHY